MHLALSAANLILARKRQPPQGVQGQGLLRSSAPSSCCCVCFAVVRTEAALRMAGPGRALNVLSAAHLDIDDTATRTGPTAGWITFRARA